MKFPGALLSAISLTLLATSAPLAHAALSAVGPPAGLDLLTGYPQRTQKIVLTADQASDLEDLSVESAAQWVRAIPSENRPTEIDLTIDTSNLAAGPHTASVTLRSRGGVVTVPISIDLYHPQISRIISDPYRNRVYLLHNGSSAYVNSRVIVLNASNGEFVREIDAGRAYQFVQSRDGDRLYALTLPDNDVLPIDLKRMRTEQPIPLPPEERINNTLFSSLEAGPGGIVYFLNNYFSGKLLAFDTASGQVIQKIDKPWIADSIFLQLRTSSDGKWLYAKHGIDNTGKGPTEPVERYSILQNGTLQWIDSPSKPMVEGPGTTDDHELNVSATGQLSFGDLVFDPADSMASGRSSPDLIRAISPGGEFTVGSSGIYGQNTSRLLASLPRFLELTAVSVTPEGNVFYAGEDGMRGLIDVPAIAGLENSGFRVSPLDGTTVDSLKLIRWEPVKGARDYVVRLWREPDGNASVSGTITLRSSYHWVVPPADLLSQGTWNWSVDAYSPTGIKTGAKRSFSIAGLGTHGCLIEVEMIKGCQAQPVDLGFALPPDAVISSLTSDSPWLKVVGGKPHLVEIDTRGQTFSASQAHVSATVVTATSTINLKATVSVRLYGSEVIDMEADPHSDHFYALVRSDAVTAPHLSPALGPFFVVRASAATGDLIDCKAVGFRGKYLRLSKDGRLLGIETPTSGYASGGLEILNTGDFSRVAHYWAFRNMYSASPQTALAGDKAFVASKLLDLSTHQVAGSFTDLLRPLSSFAPDGASIYGANQDGIYRRDTMPAMEFMNSYPVAGGGSRQVTVSNNGTRVAWGKAITDGNLAPIAQTTAMIRNISGDGKLVLTSDGLYHVPSLRKILPVSAGDWRAQIAEKTRTILLNPSAVDGVPRFQIISYGDLLEVDASSVVPSIASGSTVSTPTAELAWSELPAATSFRVFFGTDEQAIASAEAGSAFELGITSSPMWTAPLPLTQGQTYFWKIIAESPYGTSSSNVWSFRTLEFTLSEESATLLCPLGSDPVTRDISIAMPQSRPWSVTTTAPWLKILPNSGNGNGDFTVEANPATFTQAGSQSGTIKVTVGDQSQTIPITLRCYRYKIRDFKADPESPFVHFLVSNVVQREGDVETFFLMKMDSATQRHVETLDLGMTYGIFDTTFSMFVHPQDDRVYIYYSGVDKLIGCSRERYRIESEFNVSSVLGTTGRPLIRPAGQNRVVFLYAPSSGGRKLAVHNSSTGAVINAVDSNFSNNPLMETAPSGNRVYLAQDFPRRLTYIDLLPNGFTQGPEASTAFSGALAVSPDGKTVFYGNNYYDQHLNLLGQSGRPLAMNADASLFLGLSSSFQPEWYSLAGTPPVLPIPSSPSQCAWSLNDRHFIRSTSTYTWHDLKAQENLGLYPPYLNGTWVSSGPRPWIQDSVDPGSFRTGRLVDPGTGDFLPSYTLSFKTRFSGKLVYEWRNVTNGSELFELYVNSTRIDFRNASSTWVFREFMVPGNATVEFRYSKTFSGTAGTSPVGEIRYMGLVSSPAIAPMDEDGDSPAVTDSDGDGHEDQLELALGSDPQDSKSRPATGLRETAGSKVFYYERPSGALYHYQVQFSEDLKLWEDVPAPPVTTMAAGSGSGMEAVTTPLPAGKTRTFVRLVVTSLAP